MLNVYNYYDDYKTLPLYNEIGTQFHLLNPFSWEQDNRTKEDLEPVKHIILRSAQLICYYAVLILHARLPKCEPIIMKTPMFAFVYASAILANDPEWCKIPGHENGRWPEAEPYIMNSMYRKIYKKTFGIK